MNKKHLISVIIPVYNREKVIEKAVNSVLKQTFQDFEIIIINDASKDNTAKVLDQLAKQDKRIKIITNKENKMVFASRNSGMKIAKGKYIAFLDCDDEYYPTKLQKQLDYLKEHPDIDFVYTQYYVINLNTKEKKLVKPSHERLLQDVEFALSSVLFSKKVVDTIGMYDVSFIHDEWAFWLRIAENFKMGCVNEPLLKYYIQGTNLSLTRPNRIRFELKVQYETMKQAYLRRGKPFIFLLKLWKTRLGMLVSYIATEKNLPFLRRVHKLINKVEEKMIKL